MLLAHEAANRFGPTRFLVTPASNVTVQQNMKLITVSIDSGPGEQKTVNSGLGAKISRKRQRINDSGPGSKKVQHQQSPEIITLDEDEEEGVHPTVDNASINLRRTPNFWVSPDPSKLQIGEQNLSEGKRIAIMRQSSVDSLILVQKPLYACEQEFKPRQL